MMSQPQIHLSQILTSLDHPQSNLQFLNQYLINIYSQLIPITHQLQLNRLLELLNIIHLNVIHLYITPKQRKTILEKLVYQRYQNLTMFERTLGVYLTECINATNAQKSVQTTQIVQDPNERCIKQLLMEDQILRKKDEQATNRLVKQLQTKQQYDYQISKIHYHPKELTEGIKMQCPICQQSIKPNHLAILDCKHYFHKNCTMKHYSQCINDRNFPLKCPQCNQQVIYPDIQAYLPYEYKQKYQQYTFQKYLYTNQADLSWCPTAGCEFVFVYDQGMNKFRCPSCMKKYCLKCKELYHAGTRCKQKENDIKFLKFARGAKYKECQKCKRWIEKKEGCDHITCVCKYEFCYQCGGKYGKCQCKKKKGRNLNRGLAGIVFEANQN